MFSSRGSIFEKPKMHPSFLLCLFLVVCWWAGCKEEEDNSEESIEESTKAVEEASGDGAEEEGCAFPSLCLDSELPTIEDIEDTEAFRQSVNSLPSSPGPSSSPRYAPCTRFDPCPLSRASPSLESPFKEPYRFKLVPDEEAIETPRQTTCESLRLCSRPPTSDTRFPPGYVACTPFGPSPLSKPPSVAPVFPPSQALSIAPLPLVNPSFSEPEKLQSSGEHLTSAEEKSDEFVCSVNEEGRRLSASPSMSDILETNPKVTFADRVRACLEQQEEERGKGKVPIVERISGDLESQGLEEDPSERKTSKEITQEIEQGSRTVDYIEPQNEEPLLPLGAGSIVAEESEVEGPQPAPMKPSTSRERLEQKPIKALASPCHIQTGLSLPPPASLCSSLPRKDVVSDLLPAPSSPVKSPPPTIVLPPPPRSQLLDKLEETAAMRPQSPKEPSILRAFPEEVEGQMKLLQAQKPVRVPEKSPSALPSSSLQLPGCPPPKEDPCSEGVKEKLLQEPSKGREKGGTAVGVERLELQVSFAGQLEGSGGR